MSESLSDQTLDIVHKLLRPGGNAQVYFEAGLQRRFTVTIKGTLPPKAKPGVTYANKFTGFEAIGLIDGRLWSKVFCSPIDFNPAQHEERP